jgi:hypothetical protein
VPYFFDSCQKGPVLPISIVVVLGVLPGLNTGSFLQTSVSYQPSFSKRQQFYLQKRPEIDLESV